MRVWQRSPACVGSRVALSAGGRSRCRGRRTGGLVRAGAAAAAAVVAAAALSGCAAARDELGTVNSGCYVDLPAAYQAVHHEGKLAGVQLVTVASLSAHAPALYAAAQHGATGTRLVCLFAFTGRYLGDAVSRPVGAHAGTVAVVEIGYPERHLLGTLVDRRAPLTFSHSHA